MELLAGFKKAVAECEAACEQCITLCLAEGGAMSCCNQCRDCADLCRLTFAFDSRHSVHFKDICKICLTVCEACRVECEKHQEMNEHCSVCAIACKACADACREMIDKK
jgi:hypothetical protein